MEGCSLSHFFKWGSRMINLGFRLGTEIENKGKYIWEIRRKVLNLQRKGRCSQWPCGLPGEQQCEREWRSRVR